MKNGLKNLYFALTLNQPIITLLIVALCIGSLGYFADRFELDASSDSLILEGDKAFKYSQQISARYGSEEFLFVSYTPKADLFAKDTLADLTRLRDELVSLEHVGSVVSMLDVPLIRSPQVTFSQIQEKTRTLETPGMDMNLAREEFRTSPIYKNLLMSEDAKSTALQVNLKRDEKYIRLRDQRDTLREKKFTITLTEQEKTELAKVESEFALYADVLTKQVSQDIATIRSILDKYRNNATIYLGGAPMIVSDIIDFIDHDIKVFGIGVLCFIVLLLSFSFKKPRWVLIPVVICLASTIGMAGYLGLLHWQVSVVSSNFISLMLIITLSLTIHLIVRYLELQSLHPHFDQRTLTQETVRSKFLPSFYTTLTTMVAFGSLVMSGIKPVIDFGWMMFIGVGLAFVLAFLIFPSALMLIKTDKPIQRKVDVTGHFTESLAHLIEKHSNKTFIAFALLVILSIVGISKLSVENRFIDYFKEKTEIYQGMLMIDQNLGGTTPLEVIIDPDSGFLQMQAEPESDFQDDDFEPDEDTSSGISGTSYWFNVSQLETASKIHSYLESLPETGKVLSIASTMAFLTQINEDKELDNITLSVMYKRLPDDVRESLFTPYMAADGNQIRFSIRIYESDVGLKRNDMLIKIREDLKSKFGLEDEQIKLSGMVVLYNNMLQSLFTSQIETLGAVFLAILFMFVILFRSVFISVLAIIPNIVSAGVVLGLMGLLNMPLNIMTITIAAITIGIAVDDTIHYIHRFIEEYEIDKNYWASVKRCHASIGRAMYYTSITITLGFSILALSNFIPTISFGLLTGFAMIVAMLANLTLLPLLLVKFRPLGH